MWVISCLTVALLAGGRSRGVSPSNPSSTWTVVQLRAVLLDRRVEVEPALLHLLQGGDGAHHLRHRKDPEVRVGGDRVVARRRPVAPPRPRRSVRLSRRPSPPRSARLPPPPRPAAPDRSPMTSRTPFAVDRGGPLSPAVVRLRRGWRGTSRSSPAGRPRTACGPASRAACSARPASTRRRGWPSGLVGSQRSSPSNPTRRAIVSTVSRIVTSWSVPRLIGSGIAPGVDLGAGGEDDRLGGVVDVEVLAARPPGAPHLDLVLAALDGLDALLDQRRDDVRHRRVELVAGPVEVGRDEVGEALAVLRGVDLGVHEVGLLGQPVRGVGLLRVAVPQALLAERHRRELRVRAHRAEQHRLRRRRRRGGRPR